MLDQSLYSVISVNETEISVNWLKINQLTEIETEIKSKIETK